MSRERLADAYEEQAAIYARLADATAQIAHELRGMDTGAARADSPQPSVAPVGYDDVPPFSDEDAPPGVGSVSVAKSLQEQHVETVLSQCPDHQKPWSVKAGGIGRNGKPYSAFWRCAMKNGDTWCAKKPVKAWVDSHPIEEGAAA